MTKMSGEGNGSSWDMNSCMDAIESLLENGSAKTLTPEHLAAIRHLRPAYSSDKKASSPASPFPNQVRPSFPQNGASKDFPRRPKASRVKASMRESLAEMEDQGCDEDLTAAFEGVMDAFGGIAQAELSVHNSVQVLPVPKRERMTKMILSRSDSNTSGRRLNQLLHTYKHKKDRLLVRGRLSDISELPSFDLTDSQYCPPEWTALTTEAKTNLVDLLSWENLSKWEFDILDVDDWSKKTKVTKSQGCPLLLVGWALFCEPNAQETMRSSIEAESEVDHDVEGGSGDSSTGKSKAYHYNFDDHMKINHSAICNFLREVESRYKPENPYHNNIHAADVTQTLHCLFQLMGEKSLTVLYDPIAIFSHLLAATFHDVGHPGTNNLFQQNAMTQVAIMHNDVSTLESMHSSVGNSLLMGEDQNDKWGVFAGWTHDEKMLSRRMMVSSILGTDMSKHFGYLAEFESLMDRVQFMANDNTEIEGGVVKESILCILAEHLDVTDKSKAETEDQAPLKAKLEGECRNFADKLIKFLLHCADISNPAKKKDTAIYWADCALSEFFAQGDQEKEMGLPVSPLCDRDTVKRADSQIGFTAFVIHPCFELMGEIIPRVKEEINPIVDENLEFWKKEKRRISTLGHNMAKMASFVFDSIEENEDEEEGEEGDDW